jgi:hypothetical protein
MEIDRTHADLQLIFICYPLSCRPEPEKNIDIPAGLLHNGFRYGEETATAQG